MLNGKAINITDIDPMDDTKAQLLILEEGKDVLHLFDTEELMLKWLEENGGESVAKGVRLGNHLNEYAKSSGAIEVYERTGEVPSYYQAYVDRMINPKAQPRGLGFYYKGRFSGGSFPASTYIRLTGSNNNNISSLEFIGLQVSLFDRGFFSRRLITIWATVARSADLTGTIADNRTTSTIKT